MIFLVLGGLDKSEEKWGGFRPKVEKMGVVFMPKVEKIRGSVFSDGRAAIWHTPPGMFMVASHIMVCCI